MYDISYTFVGNTLVCVENNEKKTIDKKNAIKILESVDKVKDNKIFIKGNTLYISNNMKGYTITINECTRFFLSQYRHNLENTVKIIKENEAKIQLKKHKNKKVSNNLVGKIGVAVAPIVMVSMLATTYLKKEDVDKLYSEGIEFEQIDNTVAIKDIDNINETLKEDENIKEEVSVDEVEALPEATLDLADRSMEQEVIDIQSEYKDEFIKYGKKYGVSPYVAAGLYTQESHGKGDNRGQIEHSAWEGQPIKVYNYDENKWITVVFTNSPEKYSNADITITSEELKNTSTNIAAINILLAHAANVLETDNIFAILEFYNKGAGNFNKIMDAMEANTNKTKREVLDNPTDTTFLEYSSVCGQGDPNYVCNVMQYVPNKNNGGVYFYRIVDDQVKLINVNINCLEQIDVSYAKNTR